MLAEEIRREEGREAEHRSHGQIDVARQDDERLSERKQREDRRVDEDELDVRRVDEAWLGNSRHCDEENEYRDDAELADAEHEVDDPARIVHRSARCDAVPRVDGGGHAAALPVAADTIACSDASACANSAAIRPSRITRMRFASRSTSGSSEEMTRIATPSPASSSRSRCTSAFVPMSMPRVGSSTMRTAGRRPSHFARTTFC